MRAGIGGPAYCTLIGNADFLSLQRYPVPPWSTR